MIAPGTVLRRREPVEPDDGWNRVRVVGQFEGEVVVAALGAFVEPIPATPESLALAYAIEAEPPADAPRWEAGPVGEVSHAS